jgi:hypothetical protein
MPTQETFANRPSRQAGHFDMATRESEIDGGAV